MKKLIISGIMLSALFTSYAQSETQSDNKQSILEARKAALAAPAVGKGHLRENPQVISKEEFGVKQDALNLERARRMEAAQKARNGNASLLERQQSGERKAAANLTPEQNEARIAKMNAYKESMKAREKANVQRDGLQQANPALRQQHLGQPARPANTLEKRIQEKQ